MMLANYISDLLYRHDCVIVPDFGGFITNKKSAFLDQNSNTFFPPTKHITFNTLLKNNDGLLANYIAVSENISFEKANNAIALTVIKWKNSLQKNNIQLENIGTLSLNNEKQIIFNPNIKINYLTESYGLASFTSQQIKRNTIDEKPVIPIHKKQDKKAVHTFVKYAATAAILLTLGFVGNNIYLEKQQEQRLANQEKALEKKIQTATFVISNPLPTIELNITKKDSKPYHVVAGAFQFRENAEKKVKQLKKLGYKSRILGKNKWGLTEVTFSSFSDRNDAINNLYKIQKTVSKDAWLLFKK